MILLTVENLKKVYGEKVIFEDISFTLTDNDKVGLIGINGTGKSSLLKIIARVKTPDAGTISTSNALVIEYLPQNPDFDEEATVLEQIFKGTSPLIQTIGKYEKVLMALEKTPQDPVLQEKILHLNNEMDALDAWQVESEAKAILTKLGITTFDKKIGELSGGQKKRVALAGALIRPCNLLILDEPTNHLDNETIDYLEEMLQNKKTAVLMVTHDRYFLDRVTNKIMELDRGQLYLYKGNYENFLAIKAQRLQDEKRLEEKRRALYKQELEWMRKGVEARRTKQKARQDRFYELEDNLTTGREDKLSLALGTSRLGKKILALTEASKSFDCVQCVKDFSYTFLRDDRIGILGKNGMGKSTLLGILSGDVALDCGTREIGETVRIGYYTQENREMDESLKVIDYIREKAEYIKLADGTMVSASKMLEKFLFPPLLHYTPIAKLSGGERRRLYLLGVLMADINFLLLDEPTNDLDIETLQVLEEFIENFNGPVVIVSHDRYFLDKTVDKLFVFEGDGKITYLPGNYTDYAARQKQAESLKKNTPIVAKAPVPKKEKSQTVKMTYHEKKEYETIEAEVEQLENTLKALEENELAFASDYSKLREILKEKEEIEAQLFHKMERWEYLTEKAQEIN